MIPHVASLDFKNGRNRSQHSDPVSVPQSFAIAIELNNFALSFDCRKVIITLLIDVLRGFERETSASNKFTTQTKNL